MNAHRDAPENRWHNADERVSVNERPWKWGELCEYMAKDYGPFPLNVGDLLEGGTNA